MTMDSRTRWLALIVLCLGDLMIVLDTTIVNVALPSIREDLGFSQTSLAWVVNAYLLTFGGFLLLGGRLGDLFGHRRLFLIGISLFTSASLACGLSNSQGLLVAARAVQGLGGAVVSAVAFSLIMILFTEPGERAKAMGVFGFVLSGGGTIGVLLGGVLTDLINWHWIFLVNLPIGVLVYALTLKLLPPARGTAAGGRLDVAGAVTVTAALMLAVYAIVNGNDTGWITGQTLGLLAGATMLLALFLSIEARVSSPLMPLGLFRLRNVATANVVGVMWAAAMFAWFFLSGGFPLSSRRREPRFRGSPLTAWMASAPVSPRRPPRRPSPSLSCGSVRAPPDADRRERLSELTCAQPPANRHTINVSGLKLSQSAGRAEGLDRRPDTPARFARAPFRSNVSVASELPRPVVHRENRSTWCGVAQGAHEERPSVRVAAEPSPWLARPARPRTAADWTYLAEEEERTESGADVPNESGRRSDVRAGDVKFRPESGAGLMGVRLRDHPALRPLRGFDARSPDLRREQRHGDHLRDDRTDVPQAPDR